MTANNVVQDSLYIYIYITLHNYTWYTVYSNSNKSHHEFCNYFDPHRLIRNHPLNIHWYYLGSI